LLKKVCLALPLAEVCLRHHLDVAVDNVIVHSWVGVPVSILESGVLSDKNSVLLQVALVYEAFEM